NLGCDSRCVHSSATPRVAFASARSCSAFGRPNRDAVDERERLGVFRKNGGEHAVMAKMTDEGLCGSHVFRLIPTLSRSPLRGDRHGSPSGPFLDSFRVGDRPGVISPPRLEKIPGL